MKKANKDDSSKFLMSIQNPNTPIVNEIHNSIDIDKLPNTIIKNRQHPWGIWLWLSVVTLIGTPFWAIPFSIMQEVFTKTSPTSTLEESIVFLPTYIEILAGLLTFGVGIPSLLMSVPSRIRILHRKHADRINLPILKRDIVLDDFFNPVLVSAVIVFSMITMFLWTIPCSTILFLNSCILQNHLRLWFPPTILVGNVLLVARFVMILRSHNKFEFLSDLEKKIQPTRNTKSIILDPKILESISEIGQYSEAGSDKDTVLSTLLNLKNINNLSYEARVKLAQSIRTVVIGGNADNFIVTIKILQEMCDEIEDVILTSSERDRIFLTAIFEELEEVLHLAFSHRNPQVRATMLEAYERIAVQISPKFSSSFLRLGREALRVKANRSAYAILGKFDTKIRKIFFPSDDNKQAAYQDFSVSDRECLYRFLGLLAYFWGQDNTARYFAHQIIQEFEHNELDHYLQDSQDYFQLNGDIETADALEQMLYEFHQYQYVVKFLSDIEILKEVELQRILGHYSTLEKLRAADYESIRACGVSEDATEVLMQEINPPDKADL